MLLIALENAKNGIDEHFLSSRLNDDNLKLLEELGEILHIKTPLRIELFDNSHLQGSSPIGAMVVFINGEKAPSMYRKFNITYSDGKDDLKSMYEVIFRRYSRLKKKSIVSRFNFSWWRIKSNINGKKALSDAGVDIFVAGLSKDDHHHTSLLLTEDEAYPLDKQDKLFLFLIRMQDEVHRFAITFHRKKQEKKLTTSFLMI